MPIYEFGCQGCRRKFEKIFASGCRTPQSAPCPRCGKRAGRVASRFAVAGATSKSGDDASWDDEGGDLGDFGGGDDERGEDNGGDLGGFDDGGGGELDD